MYHCIDWTKTNGVIRAASTEIQHGDIERVHENYRIILSKVSIHKYHETTTCIPVEENIDHCITDLLSLLHTPPP